VQVASGEEPNLQHCSLLLPFHVIPILLSTTATSKPAFATFFDGCSAAFLDGCLVRFKASQLASVDRLETLSSSLARVIMSFSQFVVFFF